MTGLPPRPLIDPPPSERATPTVIWESFMGRHSETTKHHTSTGRERLPPTKG